MRRPLSWNYELLRLAAIPYDVVEESRPYTVNVRLPDGKALRFYWGLSNNGRHRYVGGAADREIFSRAGLNYPPANDLIDSTGGAGPGHRTVCIEHGRPLLYGPVLLP